VSTVRRDLSAVTRAARRVDRVLVPYHRARVRGLDRLPAGPALLVGNHNGGFYTGDSYVLGAAVHRAHGPAGVPWVLTHDLGLALLGRWLRPLGAVPADPGIAAALLRRGDRVLVYPGGDADGARSWWRRNEVVLDDRLGFARLAIGLGVPVVPVAAAGAHSTAVILWDGAPVARLLRTRRWLRLSRWPLMLSLPWGLTFLPSVPYLPLPARITITVGQPLRFPRSGPEAAADEEYVRRCAAEAHTALQGLLDATTAERRRRRRRLRGRSGRPSTADGPAGAAAASPWPSGTP
jgi:1-acyl-sn-glycerol-3-phosphate acyltransferase